MKAFWDIAPCTVVEIDRVSEVRTASTIAVMMEAVRTSETSVYFINKTTRRYIPEGCHLHTRRRENQKSHIGGMGCGMDQTLQNKFQQRSFVNMVMNIRVK
jgi:hypothetical protein